MTGPLNSTSSSSLVIFMSFLLYVSFQTGKPYACTFSVALVVPLASRPPPVRGRTPVDWLGQPLRRTRPLRSGNRGAEHEKTGSGAQDSGADRPRKPRGRRSRGRPQPAADRSVVVVWKPKTSAHLERRCKSGCVIRVIRHGKYPSCPKLLKALVKRKGEIIYGISPIPKRLR